MKKTVKMIDSVQGLSESEAAAYLDSATITKSIASLVRDFPPQVVATGAITACAILILGRPLRESDTDVLDACVEFVNKMIAAKDILREDATWMADEPKSVM